MGISTSGSLLLIFLGLFLALGTMYTTTSNTTERVTDAYGDQMAQQAAIEETSINVTRAIYHETDGNLTIRVNNTGQRTLSVEATDTFVDGTYTAAEQFAIATVDGTDSDVWGQREQLRLETATDQPTRVKVVSQEGIADTATVTPMGLAGGNPQTLDRSANNTESTVAFELTSSYDENVTLQSITIEGVDNENPTYYNFSQDSDISEVNVSKSADPGTPIATVDGNFTLGERVPHAGVTLEPGSGVRYTVGEFRDVNGLAVDMPNTTVTITITYEDPRGVVRTYTFTEDGF